MANLLFEQVSWDTTLSVVYNIYIYMRSTASQQQGREEAGQCAFTIACARLFLGCRRDSPPPAVQIHLIDQPPCGYAIDPLPARPTESAAVDVCGGCVHVCVSRY